MKCPSVLFSAVLMAAVPFCVQAEKGYGTLKFSIEVTGVHYVPTPEGGHRNVEKKRTVTGEARLKFAGRTMVAPQPRGYDRAAFEREKDACERKSSDEQDIAACQDEVQERQNAAERVALQRSNPVVQALHTPRAEVWSNASCSADIEVADRGTYRGVVVGEGQGGMRELQYSLSGRHRVNDKTVGADECSVSLVYDPQKHTANINIDPGPPRIQVTERLGGKESATQLSLGGQATTMQINPLDWTAIRKFEKNDVKVTAGKTGHSGAWNERTGQPIALDGSNRVRGEVVETVTRITWHFTGEALPPEPRVIDVEQDERDNGPIRGVPRDEDPIAGCLQDERDAGREPPDPMKMLECIERKSK